MQNKSKLLMIDRDGVLVVNTPDNIKTPRQLRLIPNAAEAIACLNRSGYYVAMCTNQPEVGRGVMTRGQLDEVHDALEQMLAERGAHIDLILACTSVAKCPSRKPAAGMLREALARSDAMPAETAFVGDQIDDLEAAFHAGCRRVLVRTGLGRKTAAAPIPHWLRPLTIVEDLAAAVVMELTRDGTTSIQACR